MYYVGAVYNTSGQLDKDTNNVRHYVVKADYLQTAFRTIFKHGLEDILQREVTEQEIDYLLTPEVNRGFVNTDVTRIWWLRDESLEAYKYEVLRHWTFTTHRAQFFMV